MKSIAITNAVMREAIAYKLRQLLHRNYIKINKQHRKEAWYSPIVEETQIYEVDQMWFYEINTSEGQQFVCEIHFQRFFIEEDLFRHVESVFEQQTTGDRVINYLTS